MKKRIINNFGKYLALLLVMALIISAISIMFCNWSISFADALNLKDYSRDYSELTDVELDRLTFRTEKSDDMPQITVFTHGYGGNAGHWSNGISAGKGGAFAYEADSMIEQLKFKLGGEQKTTIIVAQTGYNDNSNLNISQSEATSKFVSGENNNFVDMETEKDLLTDSEKIGALSLRCQYYGKNAQEKELFLARCSYSLGEYSAPYKELTEAGNNNKYKIGLSRAEVEKHIILIFQACNSDGSNDSVYAQLEYILDSISYQYCQLTGELPTYNLIGHSRGGITNMQYALAHPYNVASIYSMGTPYNGSAFGSADMPDGSNFFLQIADINKTYQYNDNINYSPGVLDILNKNLNDSYKCFWNKNYQKWYNHIKFNPIGGYVSVGFVLQVLAELCGDFTPLMRFFMDMFESGFSLGEKVASYVCERLLRKNIYEILNGIDIQGDSGWEAVLLNFSFSLAQYPHLGVTKRNLVVYYDDLFIDLNSQVARGYEGTNVKVCLFDSQDQKFCKKNVDNVGIGHNIETHQIDIINYIINDINVGIYSPYNIKYLGNNTCSITKINSDINEVTIPEYIDGLKVVGIDSLYDGVIIGEENNFCLLSNIQTIVIPSTVEYIGDAAFYGMKNLKRVIFKNNHCVKIGDWAFAYSGLEVMGSANGTQGVVTLCERLTDLGEYAFAYCNNVKEFKISYKNENFFTEDGILYSQSEEREGINKYYYTEMVAYPAGKTDEYFSATKNLNFICNGAFAGNKNLKRVNLNNIYRVGFGAFAGCENITNVSGNIGFAEVGAFDDTAWFKNPQNSELDLGGILIKYSGDASEYVLPEKYNAIYATAFTESDIDKLVMTHNKLVGISSLMFKKDLSVKVPSNLLNEYLENGNWQLVNGRISEIISVITFDSDGGSEVEPLFVRYGESYQFSVPQKREGLVFLGWSYNGELIANSVGETFRPWRYIDGVTLKAEWRPEYYELKMVQDENGNYWLKIGDATFDISDVFQTTKFGAEMGEMFSTRLLEYVKTTVGLTFPEKLRLVFCLTERL